MLAMVVNDDAGHLMPCGVFRFFASMLAPTGGVLSTRSRSVHGFRRLRERGDCSTPA